MLLGKLFLEDFFLRRPLTESEAKDLKIKVQCPYLPSPERYQADLQDQGFKVQLFEDLTEDWTQFTAQRLAAFRANKARSVHVHGEATVAGLEDFYSTMASLFACGAVGGARILAIKQ